MLLRPISYFPKYDNTPRGAFLVFVQSRERRETAAESCPHALNGARKSTEKDSRDRKEDRRAHYTAQAKR